jgi:hypothetical protein
MRRTGGSFSSGHHFGHGIRGSIARELINERRSIFALSLIAIEQAVSLPNKFSLLKNTRDAQEKHLARPFVFVDVFPA